VRAGAAGSKGGARGRGRDLAEEGGGAASFGTLVSAGAFAVAVLLGVALAGAALAGREQRSMCLSALQEEWPHKRCHMSGLFGVGEAWSVGVLTPAMPGMLIFVAALTAESAIVPVKSIAVRTDTMARMLQRKSARCALRADVQ